MQSEQSKVMSAIVITAIIVGGGAYYLWGNKDVAPANQHEEAVLSGSSQEYAVMGRESFSAFQCSVLASVMSDAQEEERLFTFGYEQGKKFLNALSANKISEEDVSSEVPVGITWVLGGPSIEFMLGRIYTSASDAALENVYPTDGTYISEDLRKSIAENDFNEGNCQLIGK